MSAPLFDPITLEVLWSRIISSLDEASAALYRAAFSPIVRESNDFACCLTDAAGRSLGQSTLAMPGFPTTLPLTVRHFQRAFQKEPMQEGDVLVLNDPWFGTGHLNDICIAVPIFHHGRLVGFAASAAHAPDIGGRLRSLDSREIWEEGLQIPPTKLYSAYQPDKTAFAFIRGNVRFPEDVIGDIEAQVAANRLTAHRICEILAEFKLDDFTELATVIHQRSESVLRRAIQALPAGTWTEELHVSDYFAEPLELRLALTTKPPEGELIIDYAGTGPQQPAACNSPFTYTRAYTLYAVKCILAPQVPNNEGFYGPVTVTAPEGSALNPRRPAATSVRHWLAHRVVTMVFEAFGQFAPDRVIAQSGQPPWVLLLTGTRANGEPFFGTILEFGGMGAGQGMAGLPATSFPANASNAPIEILEQGSPIRFLQRGIRRGSGGKGKWPGGDGSILEFVVENPHPIRISVYPSLVKQGALGLAGGGSGLCGVITVNGSPFDFGKPISLNPGDRVTLMLPGGGGYGAIPAATTA